MHHIDTLTFQSFSRLFQNLLENTHDYNAFIQSQERIAQENTETQTAKPIFSYH